MHDPGGPLIATARGGNVIGGGDWSEDRLIPDLMRALSEGQKLIIRSPRATRPWQHVLDCLSGYLLVGQHLLERDSMCAEAWNFGPDQQGNRTVKQVLDSLVGDWPELNYEVTANPQPHEAGLLQLDSAKANAHLGWRPVWNFDDTIRHTASWYRDWLQRGEVSSVAHLAAYCADAATSELGWARP